MNRIVSSLLVAALVVLAGCAGGIAGPDDSGSQSVDSGTVQFYVSDQPNAIGNFEHLNVTITQVGFAEADAEGNASADASANASVDAEANANASADAEAEADGETEAEADTDADADASADAWVEHEIDSRTVDLTELQGANATALGNLSVPAGEYEQVFVHVSEVNGTLESGEDVNVKLPSRTLKLNESFEVDGESDVAFVFDITVFEAGNSGKHVLKPVASESGTDVPIVDIDGDSDLEVDVLGNASAGENATIEVTRGGEAVSNATVEVDDGATVTTNANGTATVEVPSDDEFEVKAFVGGDGDARAEGEAELELDLGAGDDGDDSDSDDSDGADSDDSDAANGDSDDSDTADDASDDRGDEAEARNATADLAVVLEGTFAAGEDVTVVATDGDGNQVSGAEVRVDGEVVGETNDDGELAFELSSDVSMGSQVTVEGNGATVTVDSSTVAAAN